MAKIGIMGGTFNPVHLGHIAIAEAAYRQFHLDEVWFMPNHIPAYKSNEELIGGKERLDMLSLAVQDYPYFKISDFELQRSGKTYTYETMSLLKKQHPDIQFYFIMGADSLFYFDKWIQPEVILKNAKILAAPRNQKTISELQTRIKELNAAFHGEYFYLIDCPEVGCSSSDIRQQFHILERNVQVTDPVEICRRLNIPELVYQYIIKNDLYY